MKSYIICNTFLAVLVGVLVDSDHLQFVEASNVDVPLDISHIDPVDMCLFVCSMCYEQVF